MAKLESACFLVAQTLHVLAWQPACLSDPTLTKTTQSAAARISEEGQTLAKCELIYLDDDN